MALKAVPDPKVPAKRSDDDDDKPGVIRKFLASPIGITTTVATVVLVVQALRSSAREAELRRVIDTLAKKAGET